MLAVLLVVGVALPLALTWRSPRWRTAGRIVALVVFVVTAALFTAFVLGGTPVG